MPDNEMIAVIATLFILVFPFVILIFVKHQQTMAKIVHDSQRSRQSEDALLQEIHALKNLMAQQTILLDTLVQSQRSTPPLPVDSDVRQRIGM